MTFTECSKQISKMWRDLPEEEKKPYVVGVVKGVDGRNAFEGKWKILTPTGF